MLDEVLTFWFEEIRPEQWWKQDGAFDELIYRRFANLLEKAAKGELFSWRSRARGRLAEIIVLDQFSRNIYRNSPRAFAQDPIALALAQEAIAAGVLQELPQAAERSFLLMPFMHSESRIIHSEAEKLFREYAPANYDYELRHKAIIDRFGRYPHRNATLGRDSSAEELAFLQQPGSSF